MSVPIAAVDLLLEYLSQLLTYNHHIMVGVKEKISRLKTELTNMRQLMVKLSQYNADSKTMKLTVKEIRHVLDATEDAVDTYVLQASVQRSRSVMSRAFHNMTDMPAVFRDLEKQIGYMASKVKQISEETLRRALEVLKYQEVSQPSRPGKSTQIKALKVEEKKVVGFERATALVAKLLLTGCENLEVISIAGISGLGKTTLSRELLEDSIVKFQYRNRGLVYVSRECSRRDVLRCILALITKSKVKENMSEKELENGVLEQLKDKQYLIVLDNIWDVKDWDRLKAAFPINQVRCRVLITTTKGRVAEYANPENPHSLYRMDFLNLDNSRQLLIQRIFNGGELPSNLEEYATKIVQRCAGLPLALVLVAGILVNHPISEDRWGEVASTLQDYTNRASEVFKLIEMMYEHLPNHLRTCFLYLGVFPEESEIPAWKLVRLWVSEGFIEQVEGESNLEDVAEEYLEELVKRNLVTVDRRRSNGKIKSCRVHNSLLEFCKERAREENLFQEINKNLSLSVDPSLDQCRRLCINNPSIKKYIRGGPSGRCVRSFITFVKEEEIVEPQNISMIPRTFKLLRVLEAQSLILPRFPVSICNLVLLKYLAISSSISMIPPIFSALWNLQTLIVVNTYACSLDVKADIWRMPQFRHFHTNTSASLPSPGTQKQKPIAEGLSSIQTLCNIAPESCLKEAFDSTPKLKKLGILGAFEKVNGGSGLLQLLSELKWLENLKLLNNDENLAARLYLKDLPRHLTKLTLMNTRLEWEQMSEIGHLATLKVLKLKEFAFQGALWITQEGGFPSLINLYIGRTDLVTWEGSGDHFPKLECLELNATDMLQTFPPGLKDISSLRFVALSDTGPHVSLLGRKLQRSIKRNKSRSSFRLSVYPPDY